MSQKGFAPILILVIIALAILGITAYQKRSISQIEPDTGLTPATPTPHSSPDIKTGSEKTKLYTNHLDNYSFEYPDNWELEESYSKLKSYDDPRIDNPDLISVSISLPGDEFNTSYNQFIPEAYIGIDVSKPYPRIDQTEYFKKSQEEFDKSYNSPSSDGAGQRLYKVANTTISNQKAIQTIRRTLPGDQTESICTFTTHFIYGVYGYSISISCEDKENKQYYDVYRQALDSFKLLGPAPAPKPVQLKTYQNKKYGYSFDYPDNWLVNSYDKGIARSNGYDDTIQVIDENDKVVFGVSKTSASLHCPPANLYPKPEEVELEGKKVTLIWGCNSPVFQATKGQLMGIGGDLSNPKVKEILRSLKGLTISSMPATAYVVEWVKELIPPLTYPFRVLLYLISK